MCNDSSDKNLSRRNFLGSALTLGAGTFILNPVRALSEGIADSLILQAHAEAAGIKISRNYINIQMGGAPLRYQFDQWLRVNVDDPNLSPVTTTGNLNPMTCNSFSIDSQGNVTPTYQTFNYRNVLTPILFSQSVFNSKGEARPLTDLLNHMLVIRGFGSGLDGHQFNMLTQQMPIGGVPTISGLVAENSKSTFDAVQYPNRGGNGAFVSNKGKSQNKVSGAKPLNSLMEGFGKPTNIPVRNLKTHFKEAMDLAQTRLKDYIRSENSGSKIVAQNLTNASAMMEKGVNNLDSYWNDAVTRYKNAIESSMRQLNLTAISDKALKSDETNRFRMGTGDNFILSKERDVREAIKEVSLQNFAEGLALTEYLIKEGMACSIDIRADALLGLNIMTTTSAAVQKKNLGLDMHNTGSATAILFMTSYFRGLSAGILELMDQLGPEIWKNTVVQVQGDFGRSARSNGSGSDHGFRQMATSVFSGAFNNGPIVVGNIKLGGHNSGYDGTQGIAAPIDGYNQKGSPSPAMAAATVTALLGIDRNPYQNTASSLVNLDNGTLKAIFPPKIVG